MAQKAGINRAVVQQDIPDPLTWADASADGSNGERPFG